MDKTWWLTVLGRLRLEECALPRCVCPQALLFVWSTVVDRKVHYELHFRGGGKLAGGGRTEQDAARFAAVTLHERGLTRYRLIRSRPVEVPNA